MLYGLLFIFLWAMAVILSASETAITAASRSRIRQLYEKGNANARKIIQLQNNVGQLISAILLCNTWTITSLTALATSWSRYYCGTWGTLIASLGMSIFITLYIEITPKVYVFSRAEKSALALAPFMELLKTLLLPAVFVINKIAQTTLNLIGLRTTETHSAISFHEDLRAVLDFSTSDPLLLRQRDMLNAVLDLSTLTAREVMTPRNLIERLDCQASPNTLQHVRHHFSYRFIPVYRHDPDHIIGTLSLQDFQNLLHSNPNPTAEDILQCCSPPYFIPEETTLMTQIQNFRESPLPSVVYVQDKHGVLQGLLTPTDILEEIVGGIRTRLPESTHTLHTTNDTFLLRGTLSLRDINRDYEWNLPEDKATTLAGFILEETQNIPKVGQTFHLHGLKIEILKRMGQRIDLVRVQILPEKELLKNPCEITENTLP